MSDHKTLGFFDVGAHTSVIADASPIGVGAVLVQKQDGVNRVIYYANRSLSSVERRYSQTEKESLALVWACERFQSYLLGVDFDLITDHKPLMNIYSTRSKPSARIERWVLRLQPYNFRVVYVKGKNNIADPLSRLLEADANSALSKAQIEDMAHVRFVAQNATPRALTTREIERESAVDDELVSLHQCIEYGNWNSFNGPKLYKAIKDELCTIGKLILRGNRILMPTKLRQQILQLAHEGHLGIVRTKQALRSKVFWPGMDVEAENLCKTCHGCQITSRKSNPEPIRTTKLPLEPWSELAVDFLGPLPSGEHIMVVIDYYSRFFEIAYMKSITAEKTVKELENMFLIHGLPNSIKSDNGPQFISQVFADFCNQNGIKHMRVIPRWPQANGEVERQNASLMKRIRIAYESNLNYRQEVAKYLLAYRACVHPATGKSPAELLFGRKIRTKLPHFSDLHIDQQAHDTDSEYKGQSKIYADCRRRAVPSDISVGDQVLLKNEQPSSKVDSPYLPSPGIVTARVGQKISVETHGKCVDRNVSSVKRFLPSSCVVGESSDDITEEIGDSGIPVNKEATSTKRAEAESSMSTKRANAESTMAGERSSRPMRQTKEPAYLKDYVRY